ncbi:unnamed protein product [Plutella xylostella]|uniref:Fucosyltransferase n=1 Tax=Plutella xylostella TaxID=51655 RepID=A0A8S4EC92_PLUXY|nr:unnamed protein product [Plutella xylostella]
MAVNTIGILLRLAKLWRLFLSFLMLLVVYLHYTHYFYRASDTTTKSPDDDDHLKIILLWIPPKCVDCSPLNNFKRGRRIFEQHNCEYTNCHIMKSHSFYNDIDFKEFSAILFSGRTITHTPKEDLPTTRNPSQVYVFVQLESNTRYPVCEKRYDDFFNWTMTYRLDSTIPWTYFVVKNKTGAVVAPSNSVSWVKDMEPISIKFQYELDSKYKLAAAYISNCEDSSRRLFFIKTLNQELQRYNTEVDVFGDCGKLKCPKNEKTTCLKKLKNKYLFYLAFENSLATDYVSEKVLNAYHYLTVPIVYGMANYTRFLPPGSYINGLELGPKRLAAAMNSAFENRTQYYSYFSWHNHYTIEDNYKNANVACDLCAKLNTNNRTERTRHFRRWWNPSLNTKCQKVYTTTKEWFFVKYTGVYSQLLQGDSNVKQKN